MPNAGDLLLQNFGDRPVPAGWTLIGDNVAYRICTGTELPFRVKAYVVEDV